MTLQMKIQEERAEARAEGLAEGHEKGLVEGREKGLVEGREKGLVEGREKGLAEGLAEGRTAEIFHSVSEGDYSAARGAEKLGISQEEFVSQMIHAGFSVS